jgi:hypothetical protein
VLSPPAPCRARRHGLRPVGLAVLASLLGLPALAATQAPASRDLDRFLETSVPFCMKAPAVQCIDQGFAFADRDGDRKLSLAEARETQLELNRWTKANARRLPPQDREKLVMGLILIQTVGPEQLFASYDADRDGELTREEVTADLKLDKRPLPEILSDPTSIDWDSLSARAGEAAPLLRRLFQL